MALADYLHDETVCTDLQVRERDEAIGLLLAKFIDTDMMDAALMDRALRATLDRELLGSTAIGKGVAVPHARVEGVTGILVAFGFSEQGVEFHALDGAPVHMIFLVLGPKEGADGYLTVLQHISRLVQNDDFRRFVARADSVQGVVDLIREMDV